MKPTRVRSAASCPYSGGCTPADRAMPDERMIWVPVATLLLACAILVATGKAADDRLRATH